MGGSALPGDILKMVNNRLLLTNLPIFIHRNYELPREVSKKSLIICISYSGNTEETLSVSKKAHRKKIKLINISSGGKLINFSEKNKIPFIKIPSGVPPRCAVPLQFSALLKVFINIKLIKNIEERILELERVLRPESIEILGKNLAKKLGGKIPLIYSSKDWRTLSYIWKIKFNENSKIPAFFNVFPELNHNEMTGIGEYKTKSIREKFALIILKEEKESSRILRRIKILSQIFKEKGIKTVFIDIKGRSIFEKIFSNILLSDWTSYYMAINQKIDPTPVILVEDLKKKMGLE